MAAIKKKTLSSTQRAGTERKQNETRKRRGRNLDVLHVSKIFLYFILFLFSSGLSCSLLLFFQNHNELSGSVQSAWNALLRSARIVTGK